MDVSKLSDIRREISKRNYVGHYLSDIIDDLRIAYLSGNTHAVYKEVENNGDKYDPAGH